MIIITTHTFIQFNSVVTKWWHRKNENFWCPWGQQFHFNGNLPRIWKGGHRHHYLFKLGKSLGEKFKPLKSRKHSHRSALCLLNKWTNFRNLLNIRKTGNRSEKHENWNKTNKNKVPCHIRNNVVNWMNERCLPKHILHHHKQ